MTDTAAATTDLTLVELIRARPALTGVFEGLGLDFCCGGDRTLGEACAASGVAVIDALAALDEAAATGSQSPGDSWTVLGPAELADHIESVHHRWLHTELPELQRLAEKVLSVHGERHPELVEVRRLVDELAGDFGPHLAKEDRVLFPAIRALTEGRSGFSFGSIANPIAAMTSEHETVGGLLAQLHATTGGYIVPDDSCTTYRLFYERLSALESDTHLHVFKENSVLFPAAVELEAAASPWSTTVTRPPSGRPHRRRTPDGTDI